MGCVLVIFQSRSFTTFNDNQANVNVLQDYQHSVEAFFETLPTNEKIVSFKTGNDKAKRKRNANPHTVETMEHITSTTTTTITETEEEKDESTPENHDNSINNS